MLFILQSNNGNNNEFQTFSSYHLLQLISDLFLHLFATQLLICFFVYQNFFKHEIKQLMTQR